MDAILPIIIQPRNYNYIHSIVYIHNQHCYFLMPLTPFAIEQLLNENCMKRKGALDQVITSDVYYILLKLVLTLLILLAVLSFEYQTETKRSIVLAKIKVSVHILCQDTNHEEAKDLRSRGLCLVPISCTMQVGNETGADYWAPAIGGGFH